MCIMDTLNINSTLIFYTVSDVLDSFFPLSPKLEVPHVHVCQNVRQIKAQDTSHEHTHKKNIYCLKYHECLSVTFHETEMFIF